MSMIESEVTKFEHVYQWSLLGISTASAFGDILACSASSSRCSRLLRLSAVDTGNWAVNVGRMRGT